jgi:hypothetical protein
LCGHHFHVVVDLVRSMTLAFGRWFLGTRARRIPDCHQQHQADSGKGVITAARRWLALAIVVVVRWSKDLDIIFIMFEVLCTCCKLMKYIKIFLSKISKTKCVVFGSLYELRCVVLRSCLVLV